MLGKILRRRCQTSHVIKLDVLAPVLVLVTFHVQLALGQRSKHAPQPMDLYHTHLPQHVRVSAAAHDTSSAETDHLDLDHQATPDPGVTQLVDVSSQSPNQLLTSGVTKSKGNNYGNKQLSGVTGNVFHPKTEALNREDHTRLNKNTRFKPREKRIIKGHRDPDLLFYTSPSTSSTTKHSDYQDSNTDSGENKYNMSPLNMESPTVATEQPGPVHSHDGGDGVWQVHDISTTLCRSTRIPPSTWYQIINCTGAVFDAVPAGHRFFVLDTQTLSLSGTNFQTFSEILINTSSLKVNNLYMDNANVKDLKAVFLIFDVTELLSLYIRNNLVTSLDADVFHGAEKLEQINISNNRIEELQPNVFSQTPNLKMLSLENNKLTRLTKNLFESNTNLHTLRLHRNRISELENGTFSGLSKLFSLVLSDNQLMDQLAVNKGVFSPCSGLSILSLRNASISVLDKQTFAGLRNLGTLDLSYNQLTAIPDQAFDDLVRLAHLFLEFNQLTRVSRSWSLPRTLTSLVLFANNISDLEDGTLDGIDLTNLFLSNNRLESLPMMTQMHLNSMKNVTLDNNPWRCDCNLIFLIHFVKSSTLGYTNTSCSAPQHIRMSAINERSITCPVYKGCRDSTCTNCHQKPLHRMVKGSCVCMEGTYMGQGIGHGNYECLACPQQHYKPHPGNDRCRLCSSGGSILKGPAPICACGVGYFTNKQGDCEKCPNGTYKSYSGVGICSPCTVDHAHAEQCSYLNKENDSKLIERHPRNNTELFVPLAVAASIVFIVCVFVILFIFGRHYRTKRRLLKRYNGKMNTRSSIMNVTKDEVQFSTGNVNPAAVECRCSARHSLRIKDIGHMIGRGAFGQVYEAYAYLNSHDRDPVKVAIKRLKETATEEEIRNLRDELEQMMNVGPHPNIIGLYGSTIFEGQCCIVMEYAELGDLLSYLKTECTFPLQYVSVGSDGRMVEQSAPKAEDNANLMMFAWQIAKGMRHLEMHRYIHRDLAARNCLLTKGPIAKVSDFGLSKDAYELGHYKRVQKDRVPFKWLSPEALLWGQYSSKSDVWAFGILLWELYTFGGTPYPQVTTEQLRELHEYGYRMSKPPACPEQLYRIMRACWREDPRLRPSFRQLEQTLDNLIQKTKEVEYIDLHLHGLKTSNPLPFTPEDMDDQVTSLDFVYRSKKQLTYQYRTARHKLGEADVRNYSGGSGDSQYDETFPILAGSVHKDSTELGSDSTVTSGFQSMSSDQTI